MPRPRVLVVVENLSVPADRRVFQESRALTEAGYDVCVVCPQGIDHDREAEAEIDGIRIVRYPLRAAAGGPAGYVREYASALWHSLRCSHRLAREARFDVVHICNPPDLLFLVALPQKLRGARILFDHHDLVPELYLSRFAGGGRALYWVARILERITFALADGVISTNESYRTVAMTRGRVKADHVSVVRSAPDLGRFTPVAPESALRRGKAYLVCYVGVMGPQDGIDYALRAVAHMREHRVRDDVHVTFIGAGDSLENAKTLCRELGLDSCVEFTGWGGDELVRRYLSTADVGIAPDPKDPLNDLSTMNKIVEYMSMSIPVVAFDLKEARVSAAGAAVYASPNDEREFGRLVSELLDNPERRRKMGELGRARVEAELSWATSQQSLLDAYRRLLGRDPRSFTK